MSSVAALLTGSALVGWFCAGGTDEAGGLGGFAVESSAYLLVERLQEMASWRGRAGLDRSARFLQATRMPGLKDMLSDEAVCPTEMVNWGGRGSSRLKC